MASKFDVIVIGGGHNGLVSACYLARAGKKVLVLERRPLVGGQCVTEEPFPDKGFKVSTASYVNSLFHPQITKDLKLETDYGFAMLERSPSSFSPFPDGRYLLMGGDPNLNQREISKFSAKDAAAYPKYEAMLERIVKVVEPMLTMIPPNVLRPGLGGLWKLFQLARSFQKLGPHMTEAMEILTGAARPILDRWFESEQLKATIATDAIIGAYAAPSMPGTAYVLFHHVMGKSSSGQRGIWSYVKGGMGGLTQALAKAGKDLGVDIRCDSEVSKILVNGSGAVTGVGLADGSDFQADIVASNLDCRVTFTKLLDPKILPDDFNQAIARINYDSASLKINVALSELPNFTACPGGDLGQHHGTIHICPDQDYIERAYDDCKYGRPSKDPILECTIPSSVDNTVAPPGQHLMSMFIQYAPYKLKDGVWDEARKNQFADRCFDIMNDYAPNFKKSVLHRQVLTPVDFEKLFNDTGGGLFQGQMSLSNLFLFRPAPGYADYKTPIKGLYLCGSAAHPGGGVMGIAGWNAAKVMLKR